MTRCWRVGCGPIRPPFAAAERLIHRYLARSCWANDRVRQAAVCGAGVGLEVGAGETVDAIMTRWMLRLWPAEDL